jgi:DNA uptake protein ComE-like DNA-binding protein
MKNRFKTFLFTYFYFTPQEKRGLGALLLLFAILQSLVWAFRIWAQPAPNYFKQVSFEVLQDSLVIQAAFTSEEEADSPAYFSGNHRAALSVRTEQKDSTYAKKKYTTPKILELNTCDSLELVALPKIGPYMAHKILQYRSQLGGFYSLEQLTEIFGFQEDWLFDLEPRLRVDPSLRVKVDVNQVSFEQLKKHPYFKITLSRAIVQYRAQHGAYAALSDLKKIKLVNDSIYQLILPYCDLKP